MDVTQLLSDSSSPQTTQIPEPDDIIGTIKTVAIVILTLSLVACLVVITILLGIILNNRRQMRKVRGDVRNKDLTKREKEGYTEIQASDSLVNNNAYVSANRDRHFMAVSPEHHYSSVRNEGQRICLDKDLSSKGSSSKLCNSVNESNEYMSMNEGDHEYDYVTLPPHFPSGKY